MRPTVASVSPVVVPLLSAIPVFRARSVIPNALVSSVRVSPRVYERGGGGWSSSSVRAPVVVVANAFNVLVARTAWGMIAHPLRGRRTGLRGCYAKLVDACTVSAILVKAVPGDACSVEAAIVVAITVAPLATKPEVVESRVALVLVKSTTPAVEKGAATTEETPPLPVPVAARPKIEGERVRTADADGFYD